MKELVVDFETASLCDIKACGAHRYAEDVTTEILCLSYSLNRAKPKTWYPGDPIDELASLATDPEVLWIAHNAGFEKAIWRNIMEPIYGFPPLPNSRWHDTQASCAMKVIPLKLERAATVLRLPVRKDMDGNRFTVALSKPKKDGSYDRSPESIKRVGDYCEGDITAEVSLHRRLGMLPAQERNIWLLDQRINERGARLDMQFVRAAQKIVDEASAPLLTEFFTITDGLKPTQTAKFKAWIATHGVEIPDLKAETVDALLGVLKDEEDEDTPDSADLPDLPPVVHRALTIKSLVGSSSIKKLGRMEQCVCGDGRARGLLQYHGAGTGRWAGRIIQPQNFPKGTISESVADKVSAILTGDHNYVREHVGEPVEVVVSSLRHAIVASQGRQLLAGDFSGVEARIVLALAGQLDKCALMASGVDVYCLLAEQIYKRPITKETDLGVPRNMGKAGVLGCGFQMGWKKFQRQILQKTGIALTDEEAENVVNTYRKVFAPKVPEVWYELNEASLKCVWDRTAQEAYGVTYRMEDGWLTARIPSGRKLWYYNPQPTRRAMPWDATDVRKAWTYQAQKTGQMKTIDAYGGLLTENVVQALARDIMVEAMFKCEKNNLPVILTVHDEIITEPEDKYADPLALQQIMVDIPQWAKDMQIPIAADVWETPQQRYKK